MCALAPSSIGVGQLGVVELDGDVVAGRARAASVRSWARFMPRPVGSSAAGESAGRFCMKASTPSTKSWELARSCWSDGLEVEQLLEPGVGPVVDRALDRRVGAGRSGGQLRGQLADARGSAASSSTTSLIRFQAQRLLGRDALAQVGDLERAGVADPGHEASARRRRRGRGRC